MEAILHPTAQDPRSIAVCWVGLGVSSRRRGDLQREMANMFRFRGFWPETNRQVVNRHDHSTPPADCPLPFGIGGKWQRHSLRHFNESRIRPRFGAVGLPASRTI